MPVRALSQPRCRCRGEIVIKLHGRTLVFECRQCGERRQAKHVPQISHQLLKGGNR
jgi:tRNA(Ile2) C34 agmatinyltransferase TiaS